MSPGNRKSAVVRQLTQPVYDFEQRLLDEHLSRWAGASGEEFPSPPRLIADDVTPEAATSLLADNGGALAIISAEGDLVGALSGRYTSGPPNLNLFLKGHSGDPLRVDRVNRPTEMVASPALTIALAAQPSIVSILVDNQSFRDRGLAARFFYCLPQSLVGHWAFAPDTVPEEVSTRFEGAVTSLLQWRIAHADGDPVIIEVDPEALELLKELSVAIEPRLGEFGDLEGTADWAGKLVGGVVRITGLPHLAETAVAVADVAACDPSGPISAETMKRAIAFADYLIAHARYAFRHVVDDPVYAGARKILRWFDRRKAQEASRRQIHSGLRAHFPKVADLEQSLELLTEAGLLLEDSVTTGKPGRPGGPNYRPLAEHPQPEPAAQSASESAAD
jgi:replicative DNA helicase